MYLEKDKLIHTVFNKMWYFLDTHFLEMRKRFCRGISIKLQNNDLGVFVFCRQKVSDFSEDDWPHLHHEDNTLRRCEKVCKNLKRKSVLAAVKAEWIRLCQLSRRLAGFESQAWHYAFLFYIVEFYTIFVSGLWNEWKQTKIGRGLTHI